MVASPSVSRTSTKRGHGFRSVRLWESVQEEEELTLVPGDLIAETCARGVLVWFPDMYCRSRADPERV